MVGVSVHFEPGMTDMDSTLSITLLLTSVPERKKEKEKKVPTFEASFGQEGNWEHC